MYFYSEKILIFKIQKTCNKVIILLCVNFPYMKILHQLLRNIIARNRNLADPRRNFVQIGMISILASSSHYFRELIIQRCLFTVI